MIKVIFLPVNATYVAGDGEGHRLIIRTEDLAQLKREVDSHIDDGVKVAKNSIKGDMEGLILDAVEKFANGRPDESGRRRYPTDAECIRYEAKLRAMLDGDKAV